jgi:hypothetical protein
MSMRFDPEDHQLRIQASSFENDLACELFFHFQTWAHRSMTIAGLTVCLVFSIPALVLAFTAYESCDSVGDSLPAVRADQ